MKRILLNLFFVAIFINGHGQSQELVTNVQRMLQLFQQGSYREALDVSEKTLTLCEKEFGTSDPLYGIALVVYASSQAEMGNITSAEENFNKSLAILRKNPAPEFQLFIGNIYSGLARIYGTRGDFDEAEAALTKAAGTFEKATGTNDINYSNVMNDLGNLYKIIGDYGKSEKYLLQAATIRKSILTENHELYGISLNNLGSLYEQIGDYERAAEHYEKSIVIWQKTLGRTHPLLATGTNNLAGLFVKYGGYDKAIQYYKISLDICENVYGTDHDKYVTTLANLGNAYRQQKAFVKADEVLTKSLEIRKRTIGTSHIDYAFSLVNTGLVKMDLNKLDEAESMMLQALAIFKKVVGAKHKYTSTCENNLAFIYTRKGNVDKAETYFKSSLETTLQRIDYVFPGINDKEKTFFYSAVQKDFEYFNYFASTFYSKKPSLAADVFNYTIATKALLLNTSNKIKKRILTSGDPALIELFNQWRAKKNRLAQVWQMSDTEKAAANINETEIENEVNMIEKKLSASSELFRNAAEKKRYTWRDIQKSLMPAEAAIEIVRFRRFNFEFTDTVYYAAVIVKAGGGNPEMIFLENGNFLETKAATLYKNAIQGQLIESKTYDLFWAPIAHKLKGIQKVFISPDGVYNQININSLRNPGTGKHVIEELVIQQVTNTRDLLALPRKQSVRNAVMLGFPDFSKVPENKSATPADDGLQENETIGDSVKRAFGKTISPLPGTLAEVNAIATIFKGRGIETQIVTGVRANEAFLKKVESPSILHIATHGFFLSDVQKLDADSRGGFLGFETRKVDQNPLLRSGILLAGAERTFAGEKNSQEDGVLSAFEAMTLNLDETELVVLSACETGLGEVKNGEGVYGFQRALIIAGADAVVMSLWKVSDQVTQQLMAAFYEYWTGGRSRREAFIMAQNKIREQHPQPYYWAPFVMVGD